MKSPARQLLIDLLVCAKQTKADVFLTFQYGFTNDVFENLTMIPIWHCHLLNYQYNEVDESQVCFAFKYSLYASAADNVIFVSAATY